LSAVLAFALVEAALANASNVLILEDAFFPSWSPAGTELVCNRPSDGSYDDEDIEIWRVSDDGSDPQFLLADSLGCFLPIWLPDGEHIVYFRAYYRTQEFVVHDLEGGPALIWPVTGVWDDAGFALTPNGQEILYTVWGPTSCETWALDLASGATRFVWPGSGGRISPDGEWIAFINEGDSLCVAPLGGGPVRAFESGRTPWWTPDSRFIIFSTGWNESGIQNLVQVERDGSGRWELTSHPGYEFSPVVSPEGQRVAYSHSPSGEWEPYSVWILDLEEPTRTEHATWGGLKKKFR
jgi:Tol biopolymer transport system component